MKVFKFMIAAALAAAFSLQASAQETADLPSFPGAEGFGAITTGGRGGDVYHVTNLDDSGEGSFRWACGKSGARTIVFDVSGTIHLKSELKLRNGNVTIAGQTAPGDGICIADYPFVISAPNVIIRFMRFRLGNEALKTNNKAHEGDGLGGMDGQRVMIDHCSVSWSIDECLSVYGSKNITVQWCMVTQSLVNSGHSKGAHGYGGNWGGAGASFHHNLLAHHGSRTPRLGPRPSTQLDERLDLRNNVMYNYAGEGCYGGEAMTVNIVNNYYKPGPATASLNAGKQKRMAKPGIRTFDYCIKAENLKTTAKNYNKVMGTSLTTCTLTVDPSDKGYLTFEGDENQYEIDIEKLCIYVNGQEVKVSTNDWGKCLHKWGSYYIEGNVNTKYDDVSADNWTIGLFNQIDTGKKVDYHNATEEDLHAYVPMEFAAVTTHSADMAYERVLDFAGASLHRDAYDEMMVSDTRNGEASCIVNGIGKGFINSQDEVVYADGTTGFPALNSLEAPVDTDGDGMPDEWEIANGLDRNDPADGKAIAANGYTNLECYLNSLVAHIMEGGNEGGTLLSGKQEFGAGVGEISNGADFENNNAIYNVNGMKADEDSKGILIRNGKKFIRK
ncbi:MAG: pectate lyase [Bacteroidales bacterium]|nr:pectate lyase [Bacteroidales bacterium]